MASGTVSMINYQSTLMFNNISLSPQIAVMPKPQPRSHSAIFWSISMKKSRVVVMASAAMATTAMKKGFVEEMRSAALKLHAKDEAREGEREPSGPPISAWEPRLEGYLKFLVDSALVYRVLETALDKATFPEYEEFKKSGLERSENVAKDLEWFKLQGYSIPEPSSLGIKFVGYIEELSEKDPQAFICHFYTINFGHNAGGKMIGKKIIPAIKLKWPQYLGKVIWIQQDNARPHIKDSVLEFGRAARSDGLISDLFSNPHAHQTLTLMTWTFSEPSNPYSLRQQASYNVEDLVKNIMKAYEDMTTLTLNNAFLSLQACLIKIMKVDGGINYKLPHIGKVKLIREGALPISLEIDEDLVKGCINKLIEEGHVYKPVYDISELMNSLGY